MRDTLQAETATDGGTCGAWAFGDQHYPLAMGTLKEMYDEERFVQTHAHSWVQKFGMAVLPAEQVPPASSDRKNMCSEAWPSCKSLLSAEERRCVQDFIGDLKVAVAKVHDMRAHITSNDRRAAGPLLIFLHHADVIDPPLLEVCSVLHNPWSAVFVSYHHSIYHLAMLELGGQEAMVACDANQLPKFQTEHDVACACVGKAPSGWSFWQCECTRSLECFSGLAVCVVSKIGIKEARQVVSLCAVCSLDAP